MYGVAELKKTPMYEDPQLMSMSAFKTLEEAVNHANALLDQFREDYDTEDFERPTTKRHMAMAISDRVVWWAFIRELDEPK